MNNQSNQTIGILGGGQLARMLALAGAPLGLRFKILDNTAEACASQVAPLMVGDYRDEKTLATFADGVDVVTFDFENVPASSAHWLANHIPVFPNPFALGLTQDRLGEKKLFQSLGINTPEFAPIDSFEDLQSAIGQIGIPGILKTRRLGYDGKGQVRIKTPEDIQTAWQQLGTQELIYEAFVPFEREISVLAVRGRDGDFRTWPLTQNWHLNGILAASLAPAPNTEALDARARACARLIAEKLDYVGVFALELFVKDGQLLANEMAPRVHNSGHWTIEAAITSQFENHVRAVMGLPLGCTDMSNQLAVMLNWIGDLPSRDVILREQDAHWHDYGKSSRVGRKVGHASIVGNDRLHLINTLERIGKALSIENITAPVCAAITSIE